MTTTATARHMFAINPARITDRTLRHIASSAADAGAGIAANPTTIRAITHAANPFGPHHIHGLARILGVRVTADNHIPDNIIQIA